MTDLFLGKPAAIDFETLVASTPDGQFKSGECSTIPLLAFWRDSDGRLEDLLPRLGLRVSDVGRLYFEYPVSPPKGRGKASFTDIMHDTSAAGVAIEGKWTEPRYITVANWIKKGTTPGNRESVLDGWLSLIEPFSDGIDQMKVKDCVYQMLHRTASVCSLRRPEFRVLYQVFGRSGEKHPPYRADLEALHRSLRPKGILQLWIHEIEIAPTSVWTRIMESVPKDRPELIREALTNDGLFTFKDKSLECIGA